MAHKEISDVIRLGAALGNGIGKSLEDGKWSWTDATNFFPVISKIGPAVEGFDKLDDEWDSMNEQDFNELVAEFKSEFDLEDDKAEEFVEDHFELGKHVAFVLKKHYLKSKDETPAEGE